jgi:hypothetical protein
MVSRGADTIVFDLNEHPRPNLNEVAADVVVIGGTLEYVHDLPALVEWLAHSVAARCVCSYATSQTDPKSLRRLWESILRSSNGWMNSATEDELVTLFANVGYRCTHVESWGVQRLFVFELQNNRSAS